MPAHGIGDEIVGVARDGERFLRLRLLDARRVERHHLHGDAGRIHRGKAPFADIGELGEYFLGARAAGAQHALLERFAGAGDESRRGEMLFKRDNPHRLTSILQ